MLRTSPLNFQLGLFAVPRAVVVGFAQQPVQHLDARDEVLRHGIAAAHDDALRVAFGAHQIPERVPVLPVRIGEAESVADAQVHFAEGLAAGQIEHNGFFVFHVRPPAVFWIVSAKEYLFLIFFCNIYLI